MGLASDFGLLFLLEARDKASETFAKVDEALSKFTGTAERAGEAAKSAGESIDASLLETASGADALEVANARVEAAQAKAASTAKAQADAERDLLAAQQEAAAAADGDSAAADKLAAAGTRLTATQKESAAAAKQLAAAQKLQSDTAAAAAAKDDAAAAAQTKGADASKASESGLSGVTKAAGLMTLGMAAAGYEAVKAAGNFQDMTTHLVTDAGESAKNLSMVQAGILQVSTATGTSAADITNAMYHIESAGYHGSAGLTMLKIAAEGAKVGGADLDTVSKTLVGTMNAYGMSASQSASMMNQLIATVGAGDMRMQDLASSLSNVAPLAAANGIAFSQVGGALATMTAQGMSAQQATQDLSNTIRSLSKPNNVAITEMNQLGINSQDVSNNLGKRGLTGTIQYLTSAITSHMGKSGQVLMSAFNKSTTAGKALQTMLGTMPAGIKALAESYLNGSITAKQWTADMNGQTPINKHLMGQFATLANTANGFNSMLAKGGAPAQNYKQALANMMGGATGFNTALMISGKHLGTFNASTATVAAAAKKSGDSVDNWSMIQGTFNQKMATAKTAVENTGIALGSALLPAVTSLLQHVTRIVTPIATWVATHKHLTAVIFGSLAGLAALVSVINLAAKGFGAVSKAAGTVKSVYDGVTGAIGKIAGLFTSDAAAADTAAASTEGLTVAEEENAVATDGAAVSADAASASWIASGLAAAGAAVKTGVLKAAQIAGTVATWAATAATTALGVAIDFATGPIGAIILAIVALVGIFVLLWTKCAWFRDFWKAVWRDIKGAAKAVFNALKTAFHAVVGFYTAQFHIMARVAEDVWHALVTAFDAIKNTVTTVVGDVVGWIKTHWQLLVAIFTGPVGIVTALVVKFAGDLKKWFMDGVRGVEKAVSWFTSLPGKFVKWLADIGSDVDKGVAAVVRFFARMPGKIMSGIGSVGSLLLQKGKDIVDGLWSGIKNIWATVTTFFTGMAGTVEKWLADAGTWLYDVGKNIVNGLWNGISNALGGLESKVKGIGSSVVGWAKSALSILSPSRRMADEVGKFIPAGIAVGITGNMGAVQAAAKKAGQVTVTAAQSGLGGGAGLRMPAPVLASSRSGAGTVEMHFDLRGAVVTNEQGARNLVNQIGGVVAKQMFGQGGYKLQTM